VSTPRARGRPGGGVVPCVAVGIIEVRGPRSAKLTRCRARTTAVCSVPPVERLAHRPLEALELHLPVCPDDHVCVAAGETPEPGLLAERRLAAQPRPL